MARMAEIEHKKRIPVRYLHSSQLEQTQQRRLDKKIALELKHLQKVLRELEKRRFACEADIYEAVESWERRMSIKYHQVMVSIWEGSERGRLPVRQLLVCDNRSGVQ